MAVASLTPGTPAAGIVKRWLGISDPAAEALGAVANSLSNAPSECPRALSKVYAQTLLDGISLQRGAKAT
eukprot:8423954-Lingulodinium_polyedra.AAC.1